MTDSQVINIIIRKVIKENHAIRESEEKYLNKGSRKWIFGVIVVTVLCFEAPVLHLYGSADIGDSFLYILIDAASSSPIELLYNKEEGETTVKKY